MTTPSLPREATTPIPPPILSLSRGLTVRPYHSSDVEPMAREANDPDIAINMLNTFPSPYTLDSAHSWLAICNSPDSHALSGPAGIAALPQVAGSNLSGVQAQNSSHPPQGSLVPTKFAICQNDVLIGSIGLTMHRAGSIDARNAEIGYWIGRSHWRQGIASEVIVPFVKWTWETFDVLIRLEAGVFGWNERSGGVLKRAGFQNVGRLRSKVWKDGRATDLVLYECVREGY